MRRDVSEDEDERLLERLDSPFSVCRTSSSVSPTPSMILVFVMSPSLAALATRSTSRLCRYLARGSRTNGVRDSTVSMLCAKTSSPDRATCWIASTLQAKSGVRASIRMCGAL